MDSLLKGRPEEWCLSGDWASRPQGRHLVARNHVREWVPTERLLLPWSPAALGVVAMPAEFEPSQIGGEFVLGFVTDTDGFAPMQRYQLFR